MLNNNTKLTNYNKKMTALIIAFSAVTSFCILAVCSKCSFLYPFNDWVDANCFFTVGKTMANGGVAYRDIFEQKGVLLYFIHTLAYYISQDTFIGVFVFEVVAGTVFVFFCIKIMQLYGCTKSSFIFAPLFAAIVYSSHSFCQGDSAEEFCLPILMFCFYISQKAFVQNKFFSRTQLILTGVAGGCVLWIKFTMLGFFIGFIIMPVVWLIKEKKYVQMVKIFVYILLGVLIVTVPVLIYFAVNNALSDMFTVYFYDNIFLYSTGSNATILSKIKAVAVTVFNAYASNLWVLVFTCVGIVWTLLRTNTRNKLNNIFIIVFTILFIYGGGRKYDYYALPLSIFAVLGFTALAVIVQKLISNKHLCIAVILSAIALVGAPVLAFACSPNVSYMSIAREELPQYKFKNTISKSDNPTLLNYGTLDNGFYTVCNIVPNCKYFCNLNIPLDTIKNEQNRYVKECKTEFIVTRGKQYDFKNYELIETATAKYKGGNRTYYLYKLIQ